MKLHFFEWKLGLFDGPLAVLPGLIAAFFYARYAIDRRAYDRTRSQLEAAHARRADLAAKGVDTAAYRASAQAVYNSGVIIAGNSGNISTGHINTGDNAQQSSR